MHQPDYRDRLHGRAVLPWVRLHAIKDYYPMAALVEQCPGMRVTFNYVPSLLAQLDDYLAGRVNDEHLILSAAPAADLDQEGQLYLLRNFFMANHETMIRPYPRYGDLLEKRGASADKKYLEMARRQFTARDFRDLQVWFNLVWFGPFFLRSDAFLLELQQKGKNFTEEEKAQLLARQREVAAEVVPLLRRLVASGQIEVSTTPFYHPILPLLVDSDIARVSVPDVQLPRQTFRHPEDALEQVRKAAAFHEQAFGERPQGIWPSEGSVSAQVLELFHQQGFRWTATDENILFRSLGHALNQDFYRTGSREDLLYQPFVTDAGGGNPAIFFRDHVLSDMVGFSYSRWDARDAVEDLVHRLRGIAAHPGGRREGRVVSIILDGENAWEYYGDGGLAFLSGLYRRLTEAPDLHTTTFRGYLDRHAPEARIREIFPGSWINNNFAIWIGHREDNRAWDLLSAAREALLRAEGSRAVTPVKLEEAWEELYMAEGSDWCWWYGDDHTSGNDEVFDELYRRHLMNLYQLIGEKIPDDLLVSILDGGHVPVVEEVSSLITPKIDGRVTNYFEWLGATGYEIHRRGQTMHRTDVPVSMIYYGMNHDRLFVRVDFRVGYHDPALIGDAFIVHLVKPRILKLMIPIGGGDAQVLGEPGGERTLPAGSFAIEEILELQVAWQEFAAAPGDRVQFFLSLEKGGRNLSLWPMTGFFEVVVPGPDFEKRMWSV
jgi:alpha-amylase/alpha-mannosidase (GH57 family)